MKSSRSFPRRVLFFAVLLSLLAFLLGFGIAYQQDSAQVAALGKLSWFHLAYAEEMKDDMAVIDWSKNLEKLDSVRAFRVTSNSKSIVEGGNANYLPPLVPEGVAYRFPSNWSFQMISDKAQSPPLEFDLVLHTSPGPFFWGLFAFVAGLAVGCASVFNSLLAPSVPVALKALSDGEKGGSNPPVPAPRPAPSESAKGSLAENTPYLFIDKNYVIRQVSPSAAGLLQKKPAELLEGHFLDLTPDSDLIQAFEKGSEAKILKPFPHCPGVVVHLRPDPNGCLLILEGGRGSKPL